MPKPVKPGFVKVRCPVCGRGRLFDARGVGDIEIEVVCPKCKSSVMLTPEYIKRALQSGAINVK